MAPEVSRSDRPAASRRQDLGVLLRAGGLDHLEGEVVPEGAAVDQLQLDPEPAVEVVEDIAEHARLRRGREADERSRRIVAAVLADEAADVAVVGAEVLAPLREAVRLVDHPVADLALLEDGPDRRVPQLLRRDQEDGGIAHPNAVEHVMALR